MDPLTHLFITRKFVGADRALVAGKHSLGAAHPDRHPDPFAATLGAAVSLASFATDGRWTVVGRGCYPDDQPAS
jgi:hypothetical protein